MKVSDFVAKYLEIRGVTHCYELVGGMITHLLDSISNKTKINIVSCHHEQTAGFAAEGHARITGIPGVALATSGPGATNLLTAIASCYFDSTPALFITGQVNTHEKSGNKGLRQLGFQETNIIEMSKPITKRSYEVDSANKIPEILHEAFNYSLSGRKGPCLVDIPMNIQSAQIEIQKVNQFLIKASNQLCKKDDINLINEYYLQNLLKEIKLSLKPLVLMGGGCTSFENRKSAIKIAKSLKLPIVFSLMAVDLLPVENDLRVGFIGSYGNRWANRVLGDADLLIVIGSRLDIRQTGSDLKSFCEGKKIFQFDIDKTEVGVRVKPEKSFITSISSLENALRNLYKEKPFLKLKISEHDLWRNHIKKLKDKFPTKKEYLAKLNEINPITFLNNLSKAINSSSIFVTDVGQHQMWAAQTLQFREGDRFITSGGMGAMGFGLPAAIGCAFASSKKSVYLISGDGSFQLNIQELETLKRNKLNVKIVLFNNSCHGMVRQFQESYFKDNLQSTVVGYSAPSFSKIAKAYGLNSLKLTNKGLEKKAIEWLLLSNGPSLLEVEISKDSKVYPKLAFGRKFGEMEPEVDPISMEST